MQFINLTPHDIVIDNGTIRTIRPSGTVARVTATYTEFDENDIAEVVFGDIENLPAPKTGVIYIVSGLVASAAKRPDVVSPATGHPKCVRNEKGQIITVPGFIRG